MKHKMKLKSGIITFAVLFAILFIACKDNKQKDNQNAITENETITDTASDTVEQWVDIKREGIDMLPGVYKTEFPDDLNKYFDSLENKCDAPVWLHAEDDEHNKQKTVYYAINELNRYKHGQRKYFPDSLLRRALKAIDLEIAYIYSHGEEQSIHFGERFFFRLLEQTVINSPKIDYVTDFHSNDGNAGILNYDDLSSKPLYSFLIYKTDNGLRLLTVGDSINIGIEKIFNLQDSQGRNYYLCSNNSMYSYYFGDFFCQYLYLYDGNSLKLVASTQLVKEFSMYGKNISDKAEIIFNPRTLTWSYCLKKGDIYKKITNTPELHLKLNGSNSEFYVVKS